MCGAGKCVALLVLAAIGCNAAPSAEECEGLTRKMQTKDVHKNFGDWILVWAVSDYELGSNLLANLTSSHASFQLLVPNSRTIVYKEKNKFSDGVCASYFFNLHVPSDPDLQTLQVKSGTLLKHGNVHVITSTSVDFYDCPDCLLMLYKGPRGRYLLSYRREGRHLDVDQPKAAHDDHGKRAECLGFAHDEPFIYDGAAGPTCKDCEGVNARLPTKDLHKVYGSWVLVWSVSDHQGGQDLLPNVSSSHIELQLLPDKNTVVLNERNVYKDTSCSNYVLNLALPVDPSDAEHHTLHMVSATVEVDGVVKPYNDSAALDFYQTCPDCLLVVYKYVHGRFLLSYRREGRHLDVDQLKAAHDDHRKRAECLGFAHDEPFIYDGAAVVGYDAVPTCKKCEGLRSRLPTKDLNQLSGDWVLVWSVSDHDKGWDLLQNVSSSHVELRLLPDQRTAVFSERNLYTDTSCSNYVLNLALPSDPSDDEHLTLHMVSATVERHGAVQAYNESAALDFYQTCPDCLLVVYKYVHGRFLLSYRREGHHSDAQRLKADHDDHRKQSECLGFQHHSPFSYDGAADFCLKKSAPEKHQQ